jgi:hypothetical protein
MGRFDQARRILIRRRRTRISVWPAADDGRRRAAAGLAGGTQYRVSGLGLRHGEHLRAARGTTKLPRAVVAAGTWRSGHTPRRHDSARRRSSATASTDDTARGVNKTCVGWPPHLLDRSWTTTRAWDYSGGRLGFQVTAAHKARGG